MATTEEVVKALHDVDCGCDHFRPAEDAYYDKLAAFVVKTLDKKSSTYRATTSGWFRG